MRIVTLPLGLLQTNCYLLANDDGEALIVDPGGEPERLLEMLSAERLRPAAILLTHAHFDHIGAVPELVRALALPVVLAPGEVALYRSPANAMPPFLPAVRGLPDTLPALPGPPPAGLAYEVLPTPGHSPAGTSYYFPQTGAVFSGDALFRGSVGRTDLPGADWDTLHRAITDVLFALPPETVVYPGHGEATTIGEERTTNPFLT